MATPSTIFLPRKSHGQRSLVGYSLGYCKESDTIEHTCTNIYKHTHTVHVSRRYRWELCRVEKANLKDTYCAIPLIQDSQSDKSIVIESRSEVAKVGGRMWFRGNIRESHHEASQQPGPTQTVRLSLGYLTTEASQWGSLAESGSHAVLLNQAGTLSQGRGMSLVCMWRGTAWRL